jgi:hypothetical protein
MNFGQIDHIRRLLEENNYTTDHLIFQMDLSDFKKGVLPLHKGIAEAVEQEVRELGTSEFLWLGCQVEVIE